MSLISLQARHAGLNKSMLYEISISLEDFQTKLRRKKKKQPSNKVSLLLLSLEAN